MPVPVEFLFLARGFNERDFAAFSWSDRPNVSNAPDFAPSYARWRGIDDSDISGAPGARGGSPAEPQFFMPPTEGVAANGLPIYNWDQAAAQLTRASNGWAGLGNATSVTYGFRSTEPTTMPGDTSGFSRFTAQQIAVAMEALALWSEVANVTFTRVNDGDGYTNNASMLFGNYSAGEVGASAFAYYPGSRAATSNAGDVWINFSLANNNSNLVTGALGPHTMAHEIGHAIGIAHPGDYDASDEGDPTYPASADYWQDGRMFTVMSYFGSTALGGSLNGFAAGPQLHDIAAAQRLYGANMTTRTGDTVYGFNSNTGHAHFTITADGQSPVFAIWDAGGNDTLDFSGYSTSVEIDLRAEAFSSAGPGNGGTGVAVGNIAIARGVVIENGIGGSAADTLIGNSVANTLRGGGSADRLEGGAGADSLYGDAGDDVLIGGAGADYLDGGAGFDQARYDDADYAGFRVALFNAAINTGIAAGETFNSIEWLILSSGDDIAYGDSVANTLEGRNGNDFLFGIEGNDKLYGEAGNDHLFGGLGADELDGGADYDYARYDDADYAGFTVSLYFAGWNTGVAAGDTFLNIEALILSAGSDVGYGSDGDNFIYGRGGGDTIFGFGGQDFIFGEAGDDNLLGYDGNDHLFGGAGADLIQGSEGFDYARYDDATYAGFTVSMTNVALNTGVAAGDSFVGIEGIILSYNNDVVYGDNNNNYIYARDGNDDLYGRGGLDNLFGEAGADDFIFDTAPSSADADVIGDFVSGTDRIGLEDSFYGAANSGGGVVRLVQGPGATASTADATMVFDTTTRQLWFDANGNAAGGLTLVATLTGVTAISQSDLFFV